MNLLSHVPLGMGAIGVSICRVHQTVVCSILQPLVGPGMPGKVIVISTNRWPLALLQEHEVPCYVGIPTVRKDFFPFKTETCSDTMLRYLQLQCIGNQD